MEIIAGLLVVVASATSLVAAEPSSTSRWTPIEAKYYKPGPNFMPPPGATTTMQQIQQRGSGGSLRRDPTEMSPDLRSRYASHGHGTSSATASHLVPHMKVKARIRMQGRPMVALIEIDGRTIRVHEGGDIAVGESLPTGLRLTAVEVNDHRIRFESADGRVKFTLN